MKKAKPIKKTELALHLSSNKITTSEFAYMLSMHMGRAKKPVCRSSVRNWAIGKNIPAVPEAIAIEDMTGGEVTIRGWCKS